MFEWIKHVFRKGIIPKLNSTNEDNPSEDQTKFIWCLVGNVIDLHLSGKDQELMHGTKHFTPNTKVYCFPTRWGDGYENIKVIGRHRKSHRFISIVMPSKLIRNWRLQKVYNPFILNLMQSQNGWTNSEKDRQTILEMLEWLPDRTIHFKK